VTTADQHLDSPAPVDTESFAIRAVGRTHPGLCREVNEDSMYLDDQLGLYLVMDGMGGHASGQIASDLAVRTVVQSMKSGEPAVAEGEEPLRVWLRAANKAIFERARVDESCRGMGTTAVGIRAERDVLHICHCGDSRAYLLRQAELTQLTRDHSLQNLYQDKPELAGQLGPAASNVIVRAIGLEENAEVDHRVMAMEHGDVYLLCCDGLSDLVDDWMIKEIMTSGETLDEVADNLVRAANANGGTDNITVVLLAIFALQDESAADEFSRGDKTIPGF
jgi:protein phosphatase